jgi:HK97 family phage portal protein
MFLSDGALVTKTPIDLVRGSSYFPYMPPMSTQGWPSAYAGIYSSQLWVYVVVSKRARATARLPLPVYKRIADGGRERVDNHPMAELLRNPNPGMTGHALWLWTSSTFDIYGDTFWYKRRTNGRVTGLFPLHPSSMSYEDGSWNFDNGRLVLRDIPDSDLVKFRDFHPDSLSRGLSPLEPLRSTLENEWSARTATSSFWKRGARPAMSLTHKGQLSEPAQSRLKAQMDSISAGADKTGVTVVLEEGMEAKPMTLTAEEAQYIETRKLNREEVCAAYDMPPPAVHILDRATFSNITEQFRSVYRDTMGAILPGFEAAIDLDLRQAEWPNDKIYAEFLMDEVLRGDFETRQEALSKASHMTIAEKRKVDNLPFVEGTDRIFLNAGILPLQEIDAQAQAAESEDAEVIPLAAVRSVMGRLSWQRSLTEVDPKALTADLNGSADAVLQALEAEKSAGGDVPSLREHSVDGEGAQRCMRRRPLLSLR